MIKKNDQPLKGFDDLTFNKHPHCSGIVARLAFGSRNQFDISVVSNVFDGHGLYGNVDMCRDTEQFDYLNGTYEVAMWYDGGNSMLPLSAYDDVLAHQTPTQITKLMHQAHLNDFAWVCLLYNLRDEKEKELA